MPRQVAVVTDSTACLPRALTNELEIEVAPVSLVFSDGAVYSDSLTNSDELLARIARARRPPATSAPSPGDYLEALRRAARRSSTILCITVAARFSTMEDAATSAGELLVVEGGAEKVRVLDSGNAAMGQGFVALAAARAAARGATLEECLAVAEATTARTHLVFALTSLRYLAHGGRVPHALAWAAGALGIRPVVHYHAGAVRLVSRVRSDDRAIEKQLDMLARLSPAGSGSLHVAIQHAGSDELASRLAALVADRHSPETLFTAPFSGAITAHTGPGVFGLAFYREPPTEL